MEPEGTVDLIGCVFDQASERSVRVAGTRLIPADKTRIKIEGAALRGYRSIAVAGVRDPLVIGNLDVIEASVKATVAETLGDTIGPDAYALRFLRYGIDGASMARKPLSEAPSEVGIVIESIAPTQEFAGIILSLARSTALHQHFDGRKTTAGNLAFPFSPSDFEGGEVYEFGIYHLLEADNPDSLFHVELEDV